MHSDLARRKQIVDLLLLVRDDAMYVQGCYLLRPKTVTGLLEQAIGLAQGLLRELTAESETLGEYGL